MITKGKVAGKLYILDDSSFVFVVFDSCNIPRHLNGNSCNNVRNLNKDSFSIWHRRLGHSSCDVLSHLDFVPKKIDSLSYVPCHQAKQQRLPFPNSESFTTEIFKLIHVDLWGPYRCKTITGASYFLTIVDDFSRATWIFLLADKTQTFQTISNFFAYVSNQFQTFVKTIRTYNGTKFVKKIVKGFFLLWE